MSESEALARIEVEEMYPNTKNKDKGKQKLVFVSFLFVIALFLGTLHAMKDLMIITRLHRSQNHKLAQEIQLSLYQNIPEKYHSFVAIGIVTCAAQS